MSENGTARLTRLVRLNQAKRDLPSQSLFHAGPPYQGLPPEAVLNSAAQAAVIAEMAPDAAAARNMIRYGAIALRPCQDYGVVTPLAQVIAPSMWCFEVGDEGNFTYSPVSEGPPPALRFGSSDPGCIARARNWCAAAASEINPMLARVNIAPEMLMQAALKAGDDCHARTIAGTDLFLEALPELSEQLKADIRSNPGFVLGIWMAWGAWKIQCSQSRISAIGGNGLEFGVRLQGEQAWRVTPAIPATGKYFDPQNAARALGAIGDSAVIDACGFGGQALRHAPSLVEEWNAALPADALKRPNKIISLSSGVVDPTLVEASGVGPIINLAILNRDGAAAPIGRGFYCPPLSLFNTGEPK